MSEPMTDEQLKDLVDDCFYIPRDGTTTRILRPEKARQLAAYKEIQRLRKELEKERLGIEIMADGAAEHDAEQQEEINRLERENKKHKEVVLLLNSGLEQENEKLKDGIVAYAIREEQYTQARKLLRKASGYLVLSDRVSAKMFDRINAFLGGEK